MKSKKILLIVEGDKVEPRVLGTKDYGLLPFLDSEYEIVAFCNPIYQLYKSYKEGEYDDLVAFLRAKKGLFIEENTLSVNAFSAIYLIFDFEPQDAQYSDEEIKDILSIFNDETSGLGRIYINYPMVEAYYHLEKLPDDNYNNRKISLVNLSGKTYKKLVNTTTCIKKNKYTEKHTSHIIMHNYNKARFIINSEEKEVDYNKILEKQLEIKKENNEIYVLSTLALLPLDYNFERTMNILKDNLKEEFIIERTMQNE